MRTIQITLVLSLLVLSGCPTEEEFERVNEETDCFEVVISPDGTVAVEDEERGVPAGDDDDSAGDDDDSAGDDDDSAGDDDDSAGGDVPESLEIDLHARPGYFDQDVIGAAVVSPGGGPAGTRFDLAVVLEDTGNEQGNPVDVVNRVSVIVDNGDLTLNEFDLSESPADERRYVITLQAGGDPEQVRRTDELCIALYTEI